MAATDFTTSNMTGASSADMLNFSVNFEETKPCRGDECSYFLVVNSTFIMGTMCIAGFIGNSLSIAALYRDSRRNLTSFLFVVLAVFDNAVLLLNFFLKSLPPLCDHYGLKSACYYTDYIWPTIIAYFMGILPMCLFGSVWTTVLVTIHRAIAVLIPHRAREYTSMRNVRLQSFLLTVVALAFSAPRFAELTVSSRNCSMNGQILTIGYVQYRSFYRNQLYQILYKNILVNILWNFAPMVILAILSTKLIREIRSALRVRRTISSTPESSRQVGIHLTIMLVLIVIVFLVCQIPKTVYIILRVVLPKRLLGCPNVYYYFMNICDTLVILNSSVNFVIYCLAGKRFRLQLKRLFRSVCRQQEKRKKNCSMEATYLRSPLTRMTSFTG